MADDTEEDPRDFTARYNTPLAPAAEERFQSWMNTQSANTGRDVSRDLYDYDLRGYWQEHPNASMSDAHLTDDFKKPNHPTFSTNSRYHGADGMQGGQWGKDPSGSWTFTPGESNAYSRDELQHYFARVEPGNQLRYASRTDVMSDADQGATTPYTIKSSTTKLRAQPPARLSPKGPTATDWPTAEEEDPARAYLENLHQKGKIYLDVSNMSPSFRDWFVKNKIKNDTDLAQKIEDLFRREQ